MTKHDHLDSSYVSVPVAIETSGVFGPQSLHILKDLGRQLWSVTEKQNLFQYLTRGFSVAVQRGNAGFVLGTIGQQGSLVSFYVLFS